MIQRGSGLVWDAQRLGHVLGGYPVGVEQHADVEVPVLDRHLTISHYPDPLCLRGVGVAVAVSTGTGYGPLPDARGLGNPPLLVADPPSEQSLCVDEGVPLVVYLEVPLGEHPRHNRRGDEAERYCDEGDANALEVTGDECGQASQRREKGDREEGD